MVNFDDLRISPDGCCLIIDASIDSANYYSNRYITEIWVDSDLTFNNSVSPSSKAVKLIIPEGGIKRFNEQIPTSTFQPLLSGSPNLKGHILFFFVSVEGTISGTAPCGGDNNVYIGVAVDWNTLYHNSLAFMKPVTKNCCDIPREFIDYILRMKSLEYAIKTGHITVAKQVWDNFFSKKKKVISSVCGCNK